MAGRALWQNLKTLVDCDKKIVDLEDNIKHINHRINVITKQLAQYEQSVELKKQQLVIEKKNVALNELQATHLKNIEDQKRKALDGARGNKDYRAFEKEIAVASAARMEHEDTLVRSWYTLEKLEKSLVHDQQQLATERELLQREIASFHEQITGLTQKLTHSRNERVQAATIIPEEWRLRYERMQTAVQNPIVPVSQSSCSGCYYAIPRQDLIKLKTAGVLLCRSCYRFLYFDFNEAQDTTKASY